MKKNIPVLQYLLLTVLALALITTMGCDNKLNGGVEIPDKGKPSSNNSQQSDMTCRFIEGKYYIYLFFGEKAGFEKAWKTHNGVKKLAETGYPTLKCTEEEIKNSGFSGKVIGPYENKKRAKKSNRKLEMILREKEGWMHFYNTVCKFENGKCDRYK